MIGNIQKNHILIAFRALNTLSAFKENDFQNLLEKQVKIKKA